MSKRTNISNWKNEIDERFEPELYQVGTRLSDERKKNNLTQTEAAKLMEIGRQSVSDHERGKHLVSMTYQMFVMCLWMSWNRHSW